jgi:hypothetical protein
VIKSALIDALRDDEYLSVREQLKVGLLELSCWQDDIPAGVMKTSASRDGNAVPSEQAEETLREYIKYSKVSLEESEAMKAELTSIGLW